jgi:hypothetical protein
MSTLGPVANMLPPIIDFSCIRLVILDWSGNNDWLDLGNGYILDI